MFLRRLGIVDTRQQDRRRGLRRGLGTRRFRRLRHGATALLLRLFACPFGFDLGKRLIGAEFLDLDVVILPVDLARDGGFAAPAGEDHALHAVLRQFAQGAHGAGRAEVVLMRETFVEAERRLLVLIEQVDVRKPQRDIGKVARTARQVFGGIAVALLAGKVEEQILVDAKLTVLAVGHCGHQVPGVRRQARRDLASQVSFGTRDGGVRQIKRVFEFACRPDPIAQDRDLLADLDGVRRPLPEPGDLVLEVETVFFKFLFAFVATVDPLEQVFKGHIAKHILQFGGQGVAKVLFVLARQFPAQGGKFGGEFLFALGKIGFRRQNRVDLLDHLVDRGADPCLGQRASPTGDRRGKRRVSREIGLLGAVDHVLRVAERLFALGDRRPPLGVSGKERGERRRRPESVFGRERARVGEAFAVDQGKHDAADQRHAREGEIERRGGLPRKDRPEDRKKDRDPEAKDHQKQGVQPALARRVHLAGNYGVAAVTVDPVEQFFLFALPLDLLFQLFPFLRRRPVGAVGVRRHAAVDGEFGAVGIVGEEVVSGVFHPELRLLRVEQAFFLFEGVQFIEAVEQGDGAETALQFFEFGDFALDLLALSLVLDQFAFAVKQGFGDLDRPLFLRDQFLGARHQGTRPDAVFLGLGDPAGVDRGNGFVDRELFAAREEQVGDGLAHLLLADVGIVHLADIGGGRKDVGRHAEEVFSGVLFGNEASLVDIDDARPVTENLAPVLLHDRGIAVDAVVLSLDEDGHLALGGPGLPARPLAAFLEPRGVGREAVEHKPDEGGKRALTGLVRALDHVELVAELDLEIVKQTEVFDLNFQYQHGLTSLPSSPDNPLTARSTDDFCSSVSGSSTR